VPRNGGVTDTTTCPLPSITPVWSTTTSAPTGNATPPYEKPAPVVLPATAKNCPGGPITVTATDVPGATTSYGTEI
jgi:hypothetical protein